MSTSVREQILTHFKLSASDLDIFIKTASYRYKKYEIPKRHGGTRQIAQPTKALKLIQRWLLSKTLKSLPQHEAATAYKKHTSIKEHAKPHANHKFLLKLDFKNFFPSLDMNDFKLHCQKYLKDLTSYDVDDLIKLLFWSPVKGDVLVLSIGAPSSPFISNSLLYDFDRQVTEFCNQKEVSYTRYADDMAFSCNNPDVLRQIEQMIVQLCRSIDYPKKLKLNRQKTVNVSKKNRRFLTGLVLSNDGTVNLGREKKRMIRAQACNFANNMSSYDDANRNKIKGMLRFANSIDKEFVSSIEKMMVRINRDSYVILMSTAKQRRSFE